MRLITGKAKLLGVIGYPIEHSLSPIMHNAALAEMGADLVYLPFEIAPENLEQAIQGFAAIGIQGFSVTIPHKQTIMPLLSEISDVAEAIGAVNTIWRTEKGWSGTNTDAEGFLAPLRSRQKDWSQSVAVILGNGGAARAVVAGCVELGCAEIHIVGRDAQKLDAFSQSWNGLLRLKVRSWETLPELLPRADLLVNATPIGMSPHVDKSPLTLKEADQLKAEVVAYDLIYTPNPTMFLQQVRDRGGVTIDGLEMLIQQGAAALQIWTQQSVPVDTMRQSLREYLGLN
ncbi:MAG: shikimate dehydrogenase [Candidatus Parcubacteria bacterium]|uniref:shikimate dehydrogenase n=1 Tax=Phormidesmis priestleyi TaxID=268141 RepID=UPI00083A44E8|nr:shikimate dehydrogenase [Phormidesmis priestleyi]MBC7825800.1 shikimate dehydrogenase [Leptolyngbyaceae cyanobacterium LF-bin-113]